ncbi:hypothetical protein T439DRAFT_328851 [Meredithblackwellia eburnea MCA 4105]
MVQDNRTFGQIGPQTTPTSAVPGPSSSDIIASTTKGKQQPQTRSGATKRAQPTGPLPSVSTAERTLLSLLSSYSSSILSSSSFTTNLQSLKQHLYNKDYAAAFGGEDDLLRRVYVARWVPSRAVIYRRMFMEFGAREWLKDGGDVIFLGGGAGSEVVGLAAVLGRLASGGKDEVQPEGETTSRSTSPTVNIITYDSAEWSSILLSLLPVLQKTYLPTLTLNPVTHNILVQPLPSFPPRPVLITLLFTASELFLSSRSSTISLLSHLTTRSPKGTRLLIVESASLSQVPVGKEGRMYPMDRLLDLGLGGEKNWVLEKEEDDKWYRMPAGTEEAYPIKLENTRVMVRLFVRR